MGVNMKSSLSYQLLLYLGTYYFGCYIVIETLLLIYKSIILPYKSITLFSEFLILGTMVIIEVCRMMSSWKGNLTESLSSIGISMLLFVPAVLSCVYVLVFQSYVLRLEVILSSIYLTIQGLQFVFGLVCVATFYKGG